MEQALHMSTKLRRELVQAVAERRLELYYQPKYRLDSGGLQGVEALLRWRTRSGVWIGPSTFTPVLERNGLIEEVGRWVFERAAADCKYWLRSGRDVRRIAINVSPFQLHHACGRASILQLCSDWPAHDAALELELTESAPLLDSKHLFDVLDHISAQNVIIALDDFGVGYSSLRLLDKLPVRRIKIDRSFIRQLTSSPRSQVIVEAIINLARDMQMDTVAEGIETADQLRRVRALGCEIGQGFLFSHAVNREALLAILPPLERAGDAGYGLLACEV
jgi:EAL domain-containing protein (putative c-di-GMP-specific phosphodiesterase class I)